MTICILGENLTSLALAQGLVKIGIDVDFISNKKLKNYPKSRTLGISKSNIEFFSKEICNIDKLVWNIKDIKIFLDNDLKKELISFKNRGYLFSIIRNYELQKILIDNLKKNKKFNRKNNFKSKNYDLVINSDYTNNITKKYFSKKIEKNYNSFAYTTILKHKEKRNEQAIQIFTKNGPLAFLPLSKTETSLVYSFNNKKKITQKNFIELVKKFHFNMENVKFNEINYFPLKSSNLRCYYYKNILAFGDVLHKVHPLAGQGFNMILRDVKVLIELLKKRIDLGLPIDQSINFEFEKKTKSKNYLFSKGIDFIYELFNIERKINNNFLNKTISSVGNIKKLNNLFKIIADHGSIY